MSSPTAQLDSPLPPVRPPHGRLVVVLALILLGGIGIGVGATVLWFNQHPRATRAKSAAEIAKRIQQRNDLTDEQTHRVEEIVARHIAAIQAIGHEARHRSAARREVFIQEMRQVLTPLQFDQWNSDYQALRKRLDVSSPEPSPRASPTSAGPSIAPEKVE